MTPRLFINPCSNSRRVQSFESHTNLAPLLGALKRADELFARLKQATADIVEHVEMRDCQATLLSIRSIYLYYSNNLMKPNVLNAVSDVQSDLGRLAELVGASGRDGNRTVMCLYTADCEVAVG